MSRHLGRQSIELSNKPRIISTYCTVGPKEGEGPLKEYFDEVLSDDLDGQNSYEKAESQISHDTILKCIQKANLKDKDIEFLCGGDLLNQLTATNFAARNLSIPFIGLYGACSTMALSLAVASILVDGEYGRYVVAEASSHFSTAERQFRTPLEMGSQRAPTSQWTVTGSGAMLLSNKGEKYPYITHVTIGQVKDYGECDPNNMGAAMAPAAVDTIRSHFEDLNRSPHDYDLIATGDLGVLGKGITEKLLLELGYDIRDVYMDCGERIFDLNHDNVNCGGSGCGCSAVVSCGYIYRNMMRGNLKRVLLVSTGALMSTTSSLQGESIPGIAHAVAIEYP